MVSIAVHFNLIIILQIILREENEVKHVLKNRHPIYQTFVSNLILIKNNFLAEQVWATGSIFGIYLKFQIEKKIELQDLANLF